MKNYTQAPMEYTAPETSEVQLATEQVIATSNSLQDYDNNPLYIEPF